MSNIRGRAMGQCKVCRDELLLNPENGMCVNCELQWLREELTKAELSLSQMRRTQAETLRELAEERNKHMGRGNA